MDRRDDGCGPRARQAEVVTMTHTPSPAQDETGLVERLHEFTRMLEHADARANQPRRPSEVQTTQITTVESRLLQKCLADAARALSPPPVVEEARLRDRVLDTIRRFAPVGPTAKHSATLLVNDIAEAVERLWSDHAQQR
jgi:hypothetical protein